MKRFADLSEQEVLALAISNEEEDGRIYRDFAEGLRADFPDTAKMFDAMAAEEVGHRGMLYDLYRAKFGEHLPLLRRQDVRGFVRHKPVWLVRPLGLDEVRKYAAAAEYETARFYRKAAEKAQDASVRELLVRLAETEDKHENLAERLGERLLPEDVRAWEDATARRMFVLQYVQPGLAGLMDLMRAFIDIASTTQDSALHAKLADRAGRVVAGCAERLPKEELAKLRQRLAASDEGR
jgi:erythrin-vacuolar iron transport family protein